LTVAPASRNRNFHEAELVIPGSRPVDCGWERNLVAVTLWRRASPLRNQSAFTLVEIALSIAIIGFALVAIIGVLPAGLNVQRENARKPSSFTMRTTSRRHPQWCARTG